MHYTSLFRTREFDYSHYSETEEFCTCFYFEPGESSTKPQEFTYSSLFSVRIIHTLSVIKSLSHTLHTLKIEARRYYKILLPNYQNFWHHIPEDCNLTLICVTPCIFVILVSQSVTTGQHRHTQKARVILQTIWKTQHNKYTTHLKQILNILNIDNCKDICMV
jgi:hypothetical protein